MSNLKDSFPSRGGLILSLEPILLEPTGHHPLLGQLWTVDLTTEHAWVLTLIQSGSLRAAVGTQRSEPVSWRDSFL